jgi:uncharacterized membrane protein YcaP (DUF421 family)
MHVLGASISTDLFTAGVPVAEKVLRTLGVYLGLVFLLRVGGKRDLAQLNSFDLVVLLLLSNVVQNAVIGPDNSLSGGLLGAVVLVAMNAVVVRLVRHSDRAVELFEGSSTVVVANGELDRDSLRRLGLRDGDVLAAIRRQGASTVREVRVAQLQAGGAITVELKPEAENATKGDIARLQEQLRELLDRLGAPPGGG